MAAYREESTVTYQKIFRNISKLTPIFYNLESC